MAASCDAPFLRRLCFMLYALSIAPKMGEPNTKLILIICSKNKSKPVSFLPLYTLLLYTILTKSASPGGTGKPGPPTMQGLDRGQPPHAKSVCVWESSSTLAGCASLSTRLRRLLPRSSSRLRSDPPSLQPHRHPKVASFLSQFLAARLENCLPMNWRRGWPSWFDQA